MNEKSGKLMGKLLSRLCTEKKEFKEEPKERSILLAQTSTKFFFEKVGMVNLREERKHEFSLVRGGK